MNESELLVVVRGGGDLATGVVFRLLEADFRPIVLELPNPLVVRRSVAVASAIRKGSVTVEWIEARRAGSVAEALALRDAGVVPVLPAPTLPRFPRPIDVLIDARMAKRNIDTDPSQAALVIALGPGFNAGDDCHAVIETMRGHRLARVIWEGSALPNTGTPGVIAGKGAERVLRAPASGTVAWSARIGDRVAADEQLGAVAGAPVLAPFAGVVRGLIAPGTEVPAGMKIGDVDARADRDACFTVSDKALAIGGGVLAALLAWRARRAVVFAERPGASPTLTLRDALDLGEHEFVALTGSGGKTSLLFALAESLVPGVVYGATTHLAQAELARAPVVCRTDALEELPVALRRFGCCLVAGEDADEKVSGMPAETAANLWQRSDVRHVLVEADGSRGLPLKAPAPHEPVIPTMATVVCPVVGLSALGQPLAEVAHRPERFAALTGLGLTAAVTGEAIATLIMHRDGGLKGVPAGASVVPFLNQADTPERLTAARQIAQALLTEPRIHHVVIGALREPRPVREIHRRVRGIVLAAGSGDRMGATKQLLPWGDTSVLGQTLRQLAASELFDRLVVTGHDAAAVAVEAERHGVTSLYNPDYAQGEMLSSLQAAVRALPPTIGAVLVALADQPMVDATIIDSLLAAYRQGFGRLIAPAFRGRRGNPVLIDRAFFPALLTLPRGEAPRALLERFANAVHLVPVESETVLQDLDSPADHARWAPQTRRSTTDN